MKKLVGNRSKKLISTEKTRLNRIRSRIDKKKNFKA